MRPDIATLERATLTALPAPRQAFDGPFVVKLFHGGTGRANAAASLDPAPDPGLEARVARIEALYHRHGQPARFRSTPLDPPGLEALLAARGYAGGEDSLVHAGPAAAAALVDSAVRDEGGPTAAWMAMVATAEYQVPARQAEKRENPALLAVPAAWLLLREAGEDLAVVFTVADGACCGLYDLAVRPGFRRRGLGLRMLRAAAHWAVGQGAGFLYAQAAESNAASIGLQRALGLEEAYRYRYWVKPVGR